LQPSSFFFFFNWFSLAVAKKKGTKDSSQAIDSPKIPPNAKAATQAEKQ
jgi:hypothetical protein